MPGNERGDVSRGIVQYRVAPVEDADEISRHGVYEQVLR
jgi:hypothetical protein